MDENELKKRLAETCFVVDATSTERFFLWCLHSKESNCKSSDWMPVDMEIVNPGWAIQLGMIAKMPIVMALSWSKINGFLVMFVDCVSQVTDSRMVDQWLAENCAPRWDGGKRLARCDAMNFGQVINYVRDKSSR